MTNFEFHIRDISIRPATAIAPMDGLTDALLRGLIRRCGGCGLSVTEFVNCEALTRDVERTWAKTRMPEDERPASVQIYGRIPENLGRAAAMCEARGAQIIDLNLGCPAKQVVSGNAGSALMREPELCAQIFRSVKSAISIPMTVKMRLGWNDHRMNVAEIAHIAQEEGASMIAVHARTREEGYRGKSRWHLVRPVAESLSVPLLINGDILTRQDARQALAASGATGVMVGRGLLRNPWLLSQIAQDLAGEEVVEPTLAQRCDFLCSYIDGLESNDMSVKGILGKIKCFIGYFTRALAYSSQMRERVFRTQTIDEIRQALVEYFDILQQDSLKDIFDGVVPDSEGNARFKEGDPRRCDY
ncbi:MAG: tRNA-dihydrouridine synthase [Proteobacteria bacterium]|nr:tRNA-dihydrouridine synthase [Pseudomonadota bacterium]